MTWRVPIWQQQETGGGYIAPGSFSSKVFDPVVRWSTEAVIWLGMRL